MKPSSLLLVDVKSPLVKVSYVTVWFHPVSTTLVCSFVWLASLLLEVEGDVGTQILLCAKSSTSPCPDKGNSVDNAKKDRKTAFLQSCAKQASCSGRIAGFGKDFVLATWLICLLKNLSLVVDGPTKLRPSQMVQ
ncbi:uncharacterized protein LOC127806812 isoform X2 [Diospyros lotus]|uniref:uncharacterized protein LOC127806812 isoform X2 n=1 Tax=Diospyros lotus TaxID=55363 RepID=UPI002259BC02|nr:uncharacterized protein LOC127806812 isoform X2 [Diospyros lotus]